MKSKILLILTIAVYMTAIVRFSVSEEGHEDHGKISNEQHYESSTHNVDFDHDAFLGRGHGHDFDDLAPEEAKRRLRKIVKKHIDKNQDGFVDYQELLARIEHQRTAYMWETIDDIMQREDENKDGKISWPEYKAVHYGTWSDESSLDQKLREKIAKSKEKFDLADTNKDGVLEKDEYVYFRHPEESDHMKDIAVEEVLEGIDQNQDRVVDMEEFLGQYDEDDGEPPYWVIEDRKHFAETLDKDKSGVLEWDEVKDWVLPNKKDTLDETKHLIAGADDDEDGKLSLEEIDVHYNLFVGSSATDHGKSLREEL